MKFTELKLDKNILKGIEEAGFTTLMPVQEETLAYSLKGRDVTVQSQTGTGKTAAFLITIFHHFLDKNSQRNKKALIITPTRELAVQVEKDAKQLGRHLPFTIGSFYGGVGYQVQEDLLYEDVDIIIGTPGRLLDFNHKGKLDFRQMGYVVIDEADRMFDMGFAPDITRIMRNSAAPAKRQTMLYSATLDVNTRRLAREFMNNPAKVEITPEQVTVDTITQVLYHVARREKLNLMLGILKRETPKNALIFTNTKSAAAQVARHLEFNGYTCLHISGDLPQSKRLKVIENFKSGKLPFLVATDVAARGLHIEGLEMIINYDLPGDPENYVHRIGRTARAGKTGKAVSMACEDYVYNLEAIETFIGMKIPVGIADDGFFEKSKSQGMVFNTREKKPMRGGEADGKRRQKNSYAKKPERDGRRKESNKEPGNKRRNERVERVERGERGSERSSEPPRNDRRNERSEYERSSKDKDISKEKPKPARHGDTRDKNYAAKKKPQGNSSARRDNRPDERQEGRQDNRRDDRRNPKGKSYRENRLEYYKKKYGDNFKPPAEASQSTQTPRTAHAKHAAQAARAAENKNIPAPEVKQPTEPKKSVFTRIKSLFKKKDKM